jgi:transposase-like protein
MNHRKVYGGVFKARVVLEALQGEKTLAEIASTYENHSVQIIAWKKKALELLHIFLTRKNLRTSDKEQEELVEELYKQIGELKVENEFLKKNCPSFPLYRREEEHDSIKFFSVHSKAMCFLQDLYLQPGYHYYAKHSNVNFLI